MNLNLSKITIHGFDEAMLNSDIELRRTLEKLAGMSFGDGEIILSCAPRAPNGYMEWVSTFHQDGTPVFTLGCVQRAPGAEMEFHS